MPAWAAESPFKARFSWPRTWMLQAGILASSYRPPAADISLAATFGPMISQTLGANLVIVVSRKVSSSIR